MKSTHLLLATVALVLPGLAVAQDATTRAPGKLGGVQLPAGGAYEPQCGARPKQPAFDAAAIKAVADRANYAKMAIEFNDYVAAVSDWNDCVVNNAEADLKALQSAADSYIRTEITPLNQEINTLSEALTAKNTELQAKR